MKLVVAGGAGYIGSVVSSLLVDAGHEVTVLDNLSNGHEDAVPEGAKFINGDIIDFAKFFSVSDSIDAVLHFAAFIEAGESMADPDKYWLNNKTGSLKLIEAMRELNIKKLIFSSTAAVYGNPTTIPITESATTKPTNTYGATKLAVDQAITNEAKVHGLAATSLRYFNVAGSYKKYGERHSPESHIIPLALRAVDTNSEFTLFGEDYPTDDGTCVRDYIHVHDLALAHLLALDKLQESLHMVYNLGNGKGFSNHEVIKLVEKVAGKKMNLKVGARREGDPAVLVASSQLAERELSWKPAKPDLETMIQDAWSFYLSTRR